MAQEIAVLRRCRRCGDWRSIEAFDELGKLCKECVGSPVYRTTELIAGSRRMALTDKGRAQLAEWRAEEAPAVA